VTGCIETQPSRPLHSETPTKHSRDVREAYTGLLVMSDGQNCRDPGDAVLCPSFTFCPNGRPVGRWWGCALWLVDVDEAPPSTWSLDPKKIRSSAVKIATSRGERARAEAAGGHHRSNLFVQKRAEAHGYLLAGDVSTRPKAPVCALMTEKGRARLWRASYKGPQSSVPSAGHTQRRVFFRRPTASGTATAMADNAIFNTPRPMNCGPAAAASHPRDTGQRYYT